MDDFAAFDAPAAEPVLSLFCHMAIFDATELPLAAAFFSSPFLSTKDSKAQVPALAKTAGFMSWPAPTSLYSSKNKSWQSGRNGKRIVCTTGAPPVLNCAKWTDASWPAKAKTQPDGE